MGAFPIIPGQLYRVRIAGLDLFIQAAHGCDALAQALPKAMPCAA